jgi:hypothetical protein
VLLLETCAPDLPASADVLLAPERLAYAPVQAFAAASPQERARKDNRNWGFIVDGLLHDGMGWFTGTYELVVPIVVEGMNLARAVLSDRS